MTKRQQSKRDLRALPANLPTVARVVTPESTAPTLITYRYLTRRDGAADAPRSYASEKLYSKFGIPRSRTPENTKMDEDMCPSCRRRFGERCQWDQKVTQRCGEWGNCNLLQCCICRIGSDSDETGEDSPIQTPRYQGHRQRQTLTKGKHGWGTADLQLDEVLIDSFEMRQRMWTMDAMLFTPEKKKRPKKQGARRRRRGQR